MNPGRRAVARWAWRMLRRDWRQQVLTLLLLIVAVGAAVTGSAMAVNSDADGSAFFGNADKMILIDGDDPATVAAAISAATERYGVVEAVWMSPIAVPGSSEVVAHWAMRPDGALTEPLLAVLDGRYPAGSDEAALTDEAADLFGAALGDEIDVEGATYTVVGLVENPGISATTSSSPCPTRRRRSRSSSSSSTAASRPARPCPSSPARTRSCGATTTSHRTRKRSRCWPSPWCSPWSASSPPPGSPSSPAVASVSSACWPPSGGHRASSGW